MTVISHEVTVPLSAAGFRLDRALAEMFPDYSRTRLSGWIKSGAVSLDGAVVSPRYLLRGGERVCLWAELDKETRQQAEPIALDIVYQDEHVLVLNKPAGLVVHPGAGHGHGTLLNALLHHDGQLAELPRAGIVHRLDKDTTGLMIVARTLPAYTVLVEMLSHHLVERQYQAVVVGALIAGGTVDAPLGRHTKDRLRRAISGGVAGKHAVTHYRLRERFRAHTLIQCNLETGRTHQIRVHMAHIGHALVGDPLYGGGLKLPKAASSEMIEVLRQFRRQALHAERLVLNHPVSAQPLEFSVPPPDDQVALIEALRQDTAQASIKNK